MNTKQKIGRACMIVGILLILFIALLFLNIVQQVVTYGQDIYQEIAFRMY